MTQTIGTTPPSAGLTEEQATAFVRATLRRHRVFAALFAAGVVLRLVVLLAYRPALEFYGDSYAYLDYAHRMRTGSLHPLGYSMFLWLFSWTGSLELVTVAQHVMALASAGLLYLLLLRFAVRPWLAALAAAPLLLDGYELALEHFVMAEALLQTLFVLGFALLLWNRRPSVRLGLAAGLTLSLAVLTRTVALAPLVLAAGYLVLRRTHWKALLGFAVAAALPIVVYAGWYDAASGRFALEEGTGTFLYGRVAPFADCHRVTVPPAERVLCPPGLPASRPGTNWYVWNRLSPLGQVRGTGVHRDQLAGDFARRVIRHQPWTYLGVAIADVAHYFAPGRSVRWRDWFVQSWQFPGRHPRPIWHVSVARVGFDGEAVARAVVPPLGTFLRGYQRVFYTPGPALAGLALLGLPGAVGIGATRRRSAGLPAQLRPAAAVLALSGMALVVVPSLVTGFDFRYGLPLLVFLPPAGALGLTRWLPRDA